MDAQSIQWGSKISRQQFTCVLSIVVSICSVFKLIFVCGEGGCLIKAYMDGLKAYAIMQQVFVCLASICAIPFKVLLI